MNWTPRARYCRYACSSRGISRLHGSHHEAQKLTTTTLPRNDLRSTWPSPSSRASRKSGAIGFCPCEAFLTSAWPPPWCVTFHPSRPKSPATTSNASTCAACLSRRPITAGVYVRLVGDDEDRRADVDVVEEPLGLRDQHADAAVRGRVADRRGVGRAVDADAGHAEAHPARAERVARARRNRALARRPRRVRREPPRVPPHDDDAEAAERRRIRRLADGNA